MKKIILLGIIIMFFLKNFAMAKYEKIFFDHSIKSIEDKIINLNEYTNKAVLFVNVASYCGFTKQYDDLQKLWDKYKDKGLIVLGVPSNSFNQEKDKNDEVKNFCEVNFGINFPMSEKVDVIGKNAHPFYKCAKKNHGIAAIPKWNFHKIIIGKNGRVVETFASFTKPDSKKFLDIIKKEIKN